MRKYHRLLLLLSLFISLLAGAPAILANNDDEKFFSALTQLENQHYQQGRELLAQIGADSPCAAEARLIIADTYYREGSTNLQTALEHYQKWLKAFPDHKLAAPVMMKMAETHLRMNFANHYDNSQAALQLIKQLQELFPLYQDEKVTRYSKLLQEVLGRHDLLVARFYFERRDAFLVTRGRSLEIINKYPQFSQLDAAIWYLANAEEALARERGDNASIAYQYYQQLVREFPTSQYRPAAFDKLLNAGINLSLPNITAPASAPPAAKNSSSVWEPLNEFRNISQAGVLLNELDKIDTAILY
jgi:outer membrane assembly lipoprotein YfiO